MKLDIDCDPETTCNAGITCIFIQTSLQKTLQQTKKLFCSYARESWLIVVCIDVSCDLYTIWCTAIALVTKTGFGLIGWSVLLIHTLYDTLQLLQLERQDFDYKSGCSAVASSSKPGLGLQSCEFHFHHDQLYCNAMQNQLHSCMHFSTISDPYYLGQQSCSESLIEYP